MLNCERGFSCKLQIETHEEIGLITTRFKGECLTHGTHRRIWVAVGAGFSPRPNLKVDIGYAHLFIDDAKIAKTATGEDELRGAITGTYEAHTDILAIEARYTF